MVAKPKVKKTSQPAPVTISVENRPDEPSHGGEIVLSSELNNPVATPILPSPLLNFQAQPQQPARAPAQTAVSEEAIANMVREIQN
eukprot:CAMPEP_0168348610 /NCGR_PEP_ID=MMETSP0213-20121227/19850_1 /TAXON_ID=151035 /ORGANISM="Euplotes harpa, Strain FSP1.4" /LENGTH=85 /DNA_ID=CAMNT_0008358247 /DNA_START=1 /DNA_END=255 /DNA_ORIENTATION=+